MDKDVWHKLDSGLNHRQHEGRRHTPCVSLPLRLESAAIQLINS